MSGQNGKNTRGLSLAQPITPQYVREKSKGQTKESMRNAIMEDMKLPKYKLVSQQWDIQAYNRYKKQDNGDASTRLIINKHNELQNV